MKKLMRRKYLFAHWMHALGPDYVLTRCLSCENETNLESQSQIVFGTNDY